MFLSSVRNERRLLPWCILGYFSITLSAPLHRWHFGRKGRHRVAPQVNRWRSRQTYFMEGSVALFREKYLAWHKRRNGSLQNEILAWCFDSCQGLLLRAVRSEEERCNWKPQPTTTLWRVRLLLLLFYLSIPLKIAAFLCVGNNRRVSVSRPGY